MKRSSVVVVWKEGLHLRAAARLVLCAQQFHSSVFVRFKDNVANARSILAVLMLCAAMGSVLELEAAGDDEDAALAAVEAVFTPDGPADDASTVTKNI
ncbi:MAG: HPr family phosphocarrier protein [Chthoniobacterales bacterium]